MSSAISSLKAVKVSYAPNTCAYIQIYFYGGNVQPESLPGFAKQVVNYTVNL